MKSTTIFAETVHAKFLQSNMAVEETTQFLHSFRTAETAFEQFLQKKGGCEETVNFFKISATFPQHFRNFAETS
jgi:hypothetical protein